MNNKQALLLALLASTPTLYLQGRAPQHMHNFFGTMFDDFDALLDQQIAMMQNMRQAMHSSHQQVQPQNSIQMHEEDNALHIMITGINIDSPDAIHAGIEPDKPDMYITLPSGEIRITAHMHGNNSVISVQGRQHVENIQDAQENQDESDQASQSTQHRSTYVSQFSTQQMIRKPVNFENQTITYDGDTQTLTIQLPFIEEKRTLKPIQVTFKE